MLITDPERVERISRQLRPKYCRYCEESKKVANFPSERARKCYECRRFARIRKKYSAVAIASQMWGNLVRRCNPANRKHFPSYFLKGIEVRMTRQEFLTWAIPAIREFMKTNPGRPSLDRIDDDGDYQIGNLKIVSQSKNSGKHSTNKTNPEMAAKIRADYSSGKFTGQDLAYIWGLSGSTIARIVNNKLDCCR